MLVNFLNYFLNLHACGQPLLFFIHHSFGIKHGTKELVNTKPKQRVSKETLFDKEK
jgi:hypothetical protein